MENSSKTSPKTKGSRLGTSALVLTASKVATMLISLVAGALMARYRTLTEYGTYSQMLLVIHLVNSILLLGLPNSLNYFLARAEDKQSKREFLSVYYTLNTILSILIGVVLVICIPLMEAYFDNPLIRTFAYFLMIYPWAHIITSSVENLLVASGRNTTVVIYRIVHSIVYLGTVILVKSMNWDFRVFMALLVASDVIFTLVVYVLAYRTAGGLRVRFDKEMTARILKYSVPIGLASIVGTINIEIDKLMIGGMTDTETMQIYTLASRELPVSIVAASLTAVLLPRFAAMMKQKREREAVKLWSHAIYLSLAVIALIAAGCIAFAPQVIDLIYSPKYLPGVNVFRIYCLVLLLRCTYFGIILNASGHTRSVVYSSLISMAVNVALNYVLYRLLGLVGPAIASLLSAVAMNMSQLAFSSKAVKVPFRKIFPWGNCLKLVLINGAMAAVFVVIQQILPLEKPLAKMLLNVFSLGGSWGEIIEAIILGIVWSAVYVVLLLPSIKKHWKALNAVQQ